MTTAPVAAWEGEGYRPFPDMGWRNALQQSLEVPLLVRLLRVRPGQRILEVGCGRGIGLEAIARHSSPAFLAGIDIDPALVRRGASELQQRGVQAALYRADVRDLPFDDASFDTVIDFGTCHHVARPDAALREIARVLRPGGRFVHETILAQLLAHPTRGSWHPMPWTAVPGLVPDRTAFLWSARKKVPAHR